MEGRAPAPRERLGRCDPVSQAAWTWRQAVVPADNTELFMGVGVANRPGRPASPAFPDGLHGTWAFWFIFFKLIYF